MLSPAETGPGGAARRPWEERGSAGFKKTRTLELPGPVRLSSGASLRNVMVAYETYGRLNKARTNGLLLCHALSGDAHAAGFRYGEDPETAKPGWWDQMVGPGKAFDTNRYFVICSNVLGGCSGTTGPGSPDPTKGYPYALDFPVVTVEDMVDVQARLLDALDVRELAAVAGGSMGGMQALAWAVRYPERVRSVIAIATTPRQSAQAIALDAIGRQAILNDPAFNGGNYYGRAKQPDAGLALARMVGHVSYLSDDSMHERFGRKLRNAEGYSYGFREEFEVESYLGHQGRRFVERFDANSYLYISRAIDYFDLKNGHGSLADSLGRARAQFLVLSFSSDWLFPTYQSLELVGALREAGLHVEFTEIESAYGHDAFLLEPEAQHKLISGFLSKAARRRPA